jgi:hypothetical protein
MVTGPDWQGETPEGIKKVFRSSTHFSLAAYRTQLLNADDMDNVKQVQSGYKVQTLSEHLNQPAPPPALSIDFPAINKEMIKTHFFDYLDFILQFIPPAPEEHQIRAKLATIGVGAGKTFHFKELSLLHKAEILLGMKQGEAQVEKTMANFGTEVNGWNVASIFGDRDFYNGDWLKRAAAAKFGIFGNNAEEALYPIVTKDGNGKPLDAAGTITRSPGGDILVSDHVRPENATPDREPDQPVPAQLGDAAQHEKESGGVAHSHHSERLSGQRE